MARLQTMTLYAQTLDTTTTTAAPAAGPAIEFDDGTYEVGVDIQPGKYKAPGTAENCYWKKLARNGSIIDNYLAPGPATVIIEPSVFTFQTERCGTWRKTG